MKYLNKLFGIYGDGEELFLYLFQKKYGLKKSKKNLILEKLDSLINFENDLNRIIQDNISTANIHQKTFTPYKNINNGKSLAVVATGPSAKYYKNIKDVIHIGVNKSYLLKDINFKYYFIHDYYATKKYIQDIINYKPESCEKFFGLTSEYKRETFNRVIPESYVISANAKRYRTDWANIKGFKSRFMYDIASNPLCSYKSVVIPAAQFALWTNPKKIYIVGCDCSSNGYFDNTKQELPFDEYIIVGWKELKRFKDIYYPETEIISVNPVGLKGLFKDVYTKSFLADNGIKDFSEYEIIDED